MSQIYVLYINLQLFKCMILLAIYMTDSDNISIEKYSKYGRIPKTKEKIYYQLLLQQVISIQH